MPENMALCLHEKHNILLAEKQDVSVLVSETLKLCGCCLSCLVVFYSKQKSYRCCSWITDIFYCLFNESCWPGIVNRAFLSGLDRIVHVSVLIRNNCPNSLTLARLH